MSFYTGLIKELTANYYNNYKDNYDHYRFGRQVQRKQSAKTKLQQYIIDTLKKKGFERSNRNHDKMFAVSIDNMEPYLQKLETFYEALADGYSKKLLVKIVAFRIMGYKKVKLPSNNAAYWKSIKTIEDITDFKKNINVKFYDWKLSHIDLNKINIPVELYLMPVNVARDFIIKQYEYSNDGTLIKARAGDFVIDAGGCWGDTALYFSNEVGKDGKVFTYEFIPSNLEILKKNVQLNPQLKSNIVVVEQPVWDASDETMFYIDNGPASRVFSETGKEYDGKVQTLSIDDLVARNSISKIDFIKMDIEGAEPYALKGAVETLKKFKPKLAIAIYHSMEDFTNIPAFIESLGLGYKFYLGHYTIHAEETVLFAIA